MKFKDVKAILDSNLSRHGGDDFNTEYVSVGGKDPETGLRVNLNFSWHEPYKSCEDCDD